MDQTIKYYKRIFKNTLEPVLVMLLSKKSQMPADQWEKMVYTTRDRIINNPTEFLGISQPTPPVMEEAVNLIFRQFISPGNDR